MVIIGSYALAIALKISEEREVTNENLMSSSTPAFTAEARAPLSPGSNPGDVVQGALSEPIRVLVADSERSVRLMLCRWIERTLEAEVREADNGVDALEIVALGETELLITDLELPALSGIDLLRILQCDGAGKLEVLVATQAASESLVREAISLGVSDYLLKPLQDDWVMGRLTLAAERIRKERERRIREADRTRPRVLAAAHDPNYLDFAQSTLSGRYSTEVAKTLGDILVKTLRWQPDLVMISGDFPKEQLHFMVSRIKALPIERTPKLCLIVREEDTTGFENEVDGFLPPSFVPETLLAAVAKTLRESGACGLPDIPLIEAELDTALSQTFGMLFGMEPEMLETLPDGFEPELSVFISITSEDDEFKIVIAIRCGKALGIALAVAAIGADEKDVDEATISDSVGEILNILGGRTKNSCHQQGVEVSCGLPKVGDRPSNGTAFHTKTSFYRWNSHPLELRFEVIG